MVEIIALFLLGRHVAKRATAMKLVSWRWVLRMVAFWVLAEFIGISLILSLMSIENPEQLTQQKMLWASLSGPIFGFGGYLLVKRQLDRIEREGGEDDLDQMF